jgi:hypothetical protein
MARIRSNCLAPHNTLGIFIGLVMVLFWFFFLYETPESFPKNLLSWLSLTIVERHEL